MAKEQPNRRKDKNNPYTIYKENGRYFITFKDSQNTSRLLEINESLFDVFNSFELIDLTYLNEFDRHEEHLELSEQDLNTRALDDGQSVEDIVMKKIEFELLKKAILELPKVQRRRLVLYYFEGMIYEEIARIDGCKYQAIQESVREALKKLRKSFMQADF